MSFSSTSVIYRFILGAGLSLAHLSSIWLTLASWCFSDRPRPGGLPCIHQPADSRINLFALKKSVICRMGESRSSNIMNISKSPWQLRLNGLKDGRHPNTRLTNLQKLD